jgi:hypothetical protein
MADHPVFQDPEFRMHSPARHRQARWSRYGLGLAPFFLASCGGGNGDDFIGGPAIVSPVTLGTVSAYSASVSAVDATISPDYGGIRAYVPVAGAKRQQLFVFLPASPLSPRAYQLVGEYAAAAGLYSIGLPYPNARAVNALCTGSADTHCHGDVRQALLAGGDVPLATPAISVSTSDSIQHRLAKTLTYLNATYPTAGWGQFLDAGGNVQWSRVRVGGHGEGGVQAAYIATQIPVVQACLLSAPGDASGNGPAPWITAATTASATPGSQFFAFTHRQDALTSLASLQTAWTALGLPGAPTSVDAAAPPYGNSHQLTSNLALDWGLDYHSITAVDMATPLNADGTATYAPAWTAACF